VPKLDSIVRVLVAEDDMALRSVLERGLRENGYVVDSVGDGSAALRHLRAYEYDVAVLDWRMPEHTGLEVVEAARRAGDRTPILMLTARDTASDRVTGLDSGADDYLVKPFDITELFARIRALQRRPPLSVQPVLECADLQLDPATHVVSVSDRHIATTAIETSLIELLLRRSPAVMTSTSGGCAPSWRGAGHRSRPYAAWATGCARDEHHAGPPASRRARGGHHDPPRHGLLHGCRAHRQCSRDAPLDR
jgi:DNA-binding response OmpR family regulator